MKVKKTLPLRIQLILPIAIAIVGIVVFTSLWYYKYTINRSTENLKSDIFLKVKLLDLFFQREALRKQEEVKKSITLFYRTFSSSPIQFTNEKFSITLENQFTGQSIQSKLLKWKIKNRDLIGDTTWIDSLQQLYGGTLTIFQRFDSGFARISTTVLKTNQKRAFFTFIPLNNPISQTVLKKQTYEGRAFVVKDWFYTCYKPILINDSVVGMLYYGLKEKNFDELVPFLSHFVTGKTGQLCIVDHHGTLYFHSGDKKCEVDSIKLQQVSSNPQKIYTFNNNQKLYYAKYIPPFDLFIIYSINPSVELEDIRQNALKGIMLVSIFAIVFMVGFVYYFTTDRLYKISREILKSKRQLSKVSKALADSEDRFKKLFNSSGDAIFVTDEDENIIEVNEAACKELEYTREELLRKKITEIKSEAYKDKVSENRRIIYEKGFHQFESEHVTKSGKILKVEFISRLVNYRGEKLILSVVRNVTDRIELERKMLSAAIRGEEKERQRIARELHDGLGPLLSTLKLYVGELSGDITRQEKEDLLQHIHEIIDESIQNIRQIANNLMPSIINDYGLIKAIEHFCEKINKTNTINIHFEYDIQKERINSDLELILFRIISELINNTLKHANAENINILLIQQEQKLYVFYKDDGIGFDPQLILQQESTGLGLKSIISRIKSINANYFVSSSPGKGFSFKLEVTL
ncbi:MAG: Cache 3/Cache 2 fusion domain-containing protein [Bacteroidales bacterium]|nr:Cache 3/Cache 2 fusion domain-containing protein [Bacteroidales bacterium]